MTEGVEEQQPSQLESGTEGVTQEEQTVTIEKINKQIIDIEAYKGLIQFTQVANIENILTDGLRHGDSTVVKRKWGFGGRLSVGEAGGHVLCLTIAGRNTSFRKWKNVPWWFTGNVILPIDYKRIDPLLIKDDYKLIESAKDTDVAIGLSGPREPEIQIFPNSDTVIPKESVLGLIISPDSHKLQRRKGEETDHEYSLDLTAEHTEKMVIHRMDRLLRQNRDSHLVPVYDHNGNVIWPERIPYDEVRQRLQRK
jgi:hypothetical protein